MVKNFYRNVKDLATLLMRGLTEGILVPINLIQGIEPGFVYYF